MIKRLSLLALANSSICAGFANNVSISATSAGNNVVDLQVKWENAWNLTDSINNHDAVWVFFKSKRLGEQTTHLTIANCQMTSSGSQKLAKDGVGVMLIPPIGSFDRLELQCQIWLNEEIKGQLDVHAIEMVYCPPGPFWLGDQTSNNTFAGNSGLPFLITGNIFQFHTSQGVLRIERPTPDVEVDSLESNTYPTGIEGFYLMKYEVNQRQYAAFLQSQTKANLKSLYPEFVGEKLLIGEVRFRSAIEVSAISGSSNDIAVQVVSNQPANGEHRAVSFLSWPLLASYLDWAGLRPMTEFEYEKASRGPKPPPKHEFAWGTAYAISPDKMERDGTDSEKSSLLAADSIGIGIFSKPVGSPYVVGVARNGFAADATSTRIQSGAGYYGNFELSGNVWELCVKASRYSKDFDGRHGDGRLDENAMANVLGWPGSQGIIARGGGWNSLIVNSFSYPFRDLAISDRFYVSYSYDVSRNTTGGRGCRSF